MYACPPPSFQTMQVRARGVSLLELVVSMGVSVMVIAGLSSAMVLATHALPTDPGGGGLRLDARAAIDRLAGELMYAETITSKTATALSFTVADRGHGATGPEAIAYAWSATAEDPLTRAYNGGTAAAIIDGVSDLEFTYEIRTPDAAPPSEQPEELFLYQDSTNAGSGAQFDVANNSKLAIFFQPTLPINADGWRITRVKFMASKSQNTNGVLSVSVRAASGNGKPSGSVIDEVQVPESSFTGTWYEVPFANAGGLDPTKGYFIAFTQAGGGGTVAKIKIGTGSTASPGTKYYFDDGGGTWQEDPTSDVWIYIWGRPSVPSGGPGPSGSIIAVTLRLRPGDDQANELRREIQLLNAPEAP